MNLKGTRRVSVKKIRADGSVAKRMKLPRVKELARSFGRVGMLHDLVIRDDYTLLAGRDRFAAALLMQATEVQCKVYECDDSEAAEIMHAENAIRRHDVAERDASLRALLLETEEELAATLPILEKLTKRAIRERVGEKLGITEHAVEVAEQRMKKRAERSDGGLDLEPSLQLETWGLDLEPGWIASVATVQADINEIKRPLGAVMRSVGNLVQNKLVRQDVVQQLDAELRVVKARLVASQPAALCPWCKGQSAVQAKCSACVGTGWIGKGSIGAVPEELKDANKVMVRGHLKSIDELDMSPTETMVEL